MKQAPIPKNEKKRLTSLEALGLLDTKPEERFDQITRTATKIFQVPISTLTLVDAKREFFKSCQGLPAREGDRAISFCGHALLADKLFIIPDTKKDPRFADNPMVTGEPYIRFYAGIPITSADGERIGVFCIKDTKPRKFSKDEEEILAGLATWAELEVNSRNLSLALATLKEQEKREKLLLEQNEKIRQTTKSYAEKADIISISAHQIRTSLSAIKWIMEMFLGGDLGKLTLEQENLLRKSYESNGRAIGVVSELLLANKTEATVEKDYKFMPVDIVELIENSIFNFSGEAYARGIEVIFLKPERDFPKVNADADKLLIVIHNLLDNAIKYSNPHGKIFIIVKENAGFVQFSVKDTGIVISPEGKPKIFEKFYRDKEAMKKELVGSGIGLYTIKKIVEKHNGKIWFESGEDIGTTFYFTIPTSK